MTHHGDTEDTEIYAEKTYESVSESTSLDLLIFHPRFSPRAFLRDLRVSVVNLSSVRR
jgi:hypothetical protein